MKEKTKSDLVYEIEDRLSFNDGLDLRVRMLDNEGDLYQVELFRVEKGLEATDPAENPEQRLAIAQFEPWALGSGTANEVVWLAKLIYRYFSEVAAKQPQ